MEEKFVDRLNIISDRSTCKVDSSAMGQDANDTPCFEVSTCIRLPTQSLCDSITSRDIEEILTRVATKSEFKRYLFDRAVCNRDSILSEIENELAIGINIQYFSGKEAFIVAGQHDWLIVLERLREVFTHISLGKQFSGYHTYNLSAGGATHH